MAQRMITLKGYKNFVLSESYKSDVTYSAFETDSSTLSESDSDSNMSEEESPLILLLQEDKLDPLYLEVQQIEEQLKQAEIMHSQNQSAPDGDPAEIDLDTLGMHLDDFEKKVLRLNEILESNLIPMETFEVYKEKQQQTLRVQMRNLLENSKLMEYLRIKTLAQKVASAYDLKKALITKLMNQDLPPNWDFTVLAKIISIIERLWSYIETASKLDMSKIERPETYDITTPPPFDVIYSDVTMADAQVLETNVEMSEISDFLDKEIENTSKDLSTKVNISQSKPEPMPTIEELPEYIDDWDESILPSIPDPIIYDNKDVTTVIIEQKPITPEVEILSDSIVANSNINKILSKKQLKKQKLKEKRKLRKQQLRELASTDKSLTVRHNVQENMQQQGQQLLSKQLSSEQQISPQDHFKSTGAMTLSKLKTLERNAFKKLNLHRPTPLAPVSCKKTGEHACQITNVNDLKNMQNTHAFYLDHTMFLNRQAILISTLKGNENSVVLIYMRNIINKHGNIDEKLIVYKFEPTVGIHQVKMLARKLFKKPIYMGIFRLSGPNACVKLSIEHHKFLIK